MTSLSNRECAELLQSWGFEEAGYKGGHMILQHQGRRVQISAPGRSTATPQKALRKAARILGISLRDLLDRKAPATHVERVPVTQQKEEVMTTATLDTYVCPVCDKTGFETERGFKGHVRSHETVVCSICSQTFSRQGIGSHAAHCKPARKPRKKPIAEPLEAVGRQRPKKDLDVEVADDLEPEILDLLDDQFPSADAFKVEFDDEEFDDILEDADLDQLMFDRVQLIARTLFPTRDLTEEQTDEFINWIEATKDLFDSLYR